MQNGYKALRAEGGLSTRSVEEYAYKYSSIVKARMSAIELQQQTEGMEYRQCDFMLGCLENGWTVGDMEFLSNLFEAVGTMQPENRAGLSLIGRIRDKKIETMDDRYTALLDISKFFSKQWQFKTFPQSLYDQLNEVLGARPNYGEYPEDEELKENSRKAGDFDSKVMVEKGQRLEVRKSLFLEAELHEKRSEEEKQKIRNLPTYVMSRMTDEQIENTKKNRGQRERGIEKNNRQVIKEVYGEEIYDLIDEKHKGSEQERRVNIHHARGNRLAYEGHHVIEFDLAGTGYAMPRREHMGQHGKREVKELTKEEISQSLDDAYGKILIDETGKEYSGIRYKSKDLTLENGKTVNKTRFVLEGPNLVNIGDYSIENTRVYVRNLAKKILTEHFDKWAKGEGQPEPIYLLITGHSRGAVSAGESVHYIHRWMQDYVKEHKKENPACEKYLEYVQMELFDRDAVPGAGTALLLGKNDLRGIPNLNATVFCSMAQDHTDFVFPLQRVRGARRIIISTTDHSMELANIDLSQKEIREDAKAHQTGFYNAENGEYYRGSGISEMPDGVYITDERYNTIRITGYSQLGKLVDTVYGDRSKQKERVEVIHKMVRDWFLDNTLQISFTGEGEYEKAKNKSLNTMEKILSNPASRLGPVKVEILKLDRLMHSDASDEKIAEQNKKLIEVCRSYMKKTRIPATGDRAEKMNLVSDLLSFAMRENNYFAKGPEPVKTPDKKGYTDRQLEREEKRKAADEELKSTIDVISDLSRKTMESADQLASGMKKDPAAERFFMSLQKGAGLSGSTPVNRITQVVRDMKEAADAYLKAHVKDRDPGMVKMKHQAEKLSQFADAAGKEIAKKTEFYGDREESPDARMEERAAKIEHLKAVKAAGGKEPDLQTKARERLEEAIRIETRHFENIKREGRKAFPLESNHLALSAAKLVFLQTVKSAAEKDGYQNAEAIMKKISDHRMLRIAAMPIAAKKGFAAMAQKTGASNLKTDFEKLDKKPALVK